MQANAVFAMDNPLTFIREALTCGKSSRSIDTDQCKDETIIFVPGLHSRHENERSNHKLGEWQTSSSRVKYYSRILEGIPIAQLYSGSYIDQKNLHIELTSDTFNALRSFGLLDEQNIASNFSQHNKYNGSENEPFRCQLRTKDMDVIRAVLSSVQPTSIHLPPRNYNNDNEEQLKKSMISLIDIAVRSYSEEENSSAQPHLVFITYSATCNILASALSDWKDQIMRVQFFTEEKLELLLRETITIVTIGGLSKDYIDGPAYIHVSMHDDIISSTLGASKQHPEGGGKDAVYLHGISPYTTSIATIDDWQRNTYDIYGNDAHNMDACAIQFLSLVQRINGVSSFRQMYDFANDEGLNLDLKASLFALNYNKIGQLEMPPHLDNELLPSMIRATGGERWLWDPSFQLGEEGVDGSESPLPSMCDAEAELTQQFGYGVYDEIVEQCGK